MLESDRAARTEDIRRLVHRELSDREADQLWEALRADPEARKVYDQLIVAERALEGASDGLGALATARVKARLMHSLDEQAHARKTWWRRWRETAFSWTGSGRSARLGLGIAVATSLIIAVSLPSMRGDDDGFQARSGNPNAVVSPDFVLQVLRVGMGSDGGLRVEPARVLNPGDTVRFAVFARVAPSWVSILAVHEDGRREVLAAPMKLPPSTKAQRLNVALNVPKTWRGRVHFVAVFETSETRVDLAKVELRARDESSCAVRVVSTTVGELEVQ